MARRPSLAAMVSRLGCLRVRVCTVRKLHRLGKRQKRPPLHGIGDASRLAPHNTANRALVFVGVVLVRLRIRCQRVQLFLLPFGGGGSPSPALALGERRHAPFATPAWRRRPRRRWLRIGPARALLFRFVGRVEVHRRRSWVGAARSSRRLVRARGAPLLAHGPDRKRSRGVECARREGGLLGPPRARITPQVPTRLCLRDRLGPPPCNLGPSRRPSLDSFVTKARTTPHPHSSVRSCTREPRRRLRC